VRETENKVVLKTDGYDPFIDLLKGVCIVFVILDHCFPSKIDYYTLFAVWGKSAVPLFLMIQVFHAYKNGLYGVKFNLKKILKRIVLPFVFVELGLILWGSICHIINTPTLALSDYLLRVLKCGGSGSGAYYPWIYIQFAIILPIFVPIIKKLDIVGLSLFFIALSQAVEFFCSITNIPEWIYRLLCIRYFFVIYLGYVLATKGFSINSMTVLLAILSLFSILFFSYINANLSPIFYKSVDKWSTCHWPCYYCFAFILVVIHKLYEKLFSTRIVLFLKKTGKYSYEIFLFQMCYFEFHGFVMRGVRVLIGNEFILYSIATMIALITCIFPVVLYKERRLPSCFSSHFYHE
jgi:hypothetical protein